MAVFLAILLLITFGVGFLNPFAGLLGLLAVNVVQPGELYPIFSSLHVERLSAFFVLAAFLLHRRSISLKNPMSRQVFAFWLACFASIPLAYWKVNSLAGALGFYKTIFYFFLITNIVNTLPRVKTLIAVFIALNAWLAVSSYWAYAHGDYYVSSTFGRAEGLTSSGGDPNRLGITLVSGIPFAVLILFYGNWKLRLLGLGTIAASLFTTVLTGSRTSFFGFVALAVAFAVTRRNKALVIPVVLMLAALFITVPAQYQKRYESVEQRNQDPSYVNRILAWKAGLKMMEHNPLTGVGMYNFPDANGGEYWPGTGRKVWLQPHSLYIQLGAELGIIGVAAFAWFLWSLYGLNRSIRKAVAGNNTYPKWLQYYPTACNFSIFVLLFTGYSSHSLYRTTWYLLAAITACTYSLTVGSAKEREAMPLKRVTADSYAMAGAGVSS
jgi:O-antigen ligase